MLNLSFREGGEGAEQAFCDHKSLNIMTLRMTWEAKRQLSDLLLGAGFPDASLAPAIFSTQGPDSQLDLMSTLLVGGLYPNICWHKVCWWTRN